MPQNVLVLNYDDSRGGGVVWTSAKELQDIGFNIFELSLIRTRISTKNFFVDVIRKNTISYILFKLKVYFFNRLFLFINKKKNYCFMSKGKAYVSADDILQKCPFIPDYILIGWYDYFLSPKTIFDLYCKTGTSIIISMIDEFVIAGGCHYPFECTNYMIGCMDCPSLSLNKKIAVRTYKNKMRYWTNMPMHIVATSYDLNRAKLVPYLKNKSMHRLVGTPTIPFVLEKESARKTFNINITDFAIMAAVTNISDKRKGVLELVGALNLLACKIDENKRITLLLLGNGSDLPFIDDRINVILTGYLDKKGLYSAYYACDIFASPSLDDSGPYTVNYSIACGRPVVSFPIGVALDLVIPQKTGYLAKYKNIQDMADGFYEFYRMDKKQLLLYQDNCLSLIDKFRGEHWYSFMLK